MKIITILLLPVMKNDESLDNQNQIEKMIKGLIQSNNLQKRHARGAELDDID